MADPYDALLRGQRPTGVVPPPNLAVPSQGDAYDTLLRGRPPTQPPPSTEGKLFGELKPADESWSDWLKHKAMRGFEALGMQPQYIRHMGEAAIGIPSTVTPMGSILSAADAIYNAQRGNYGDAALNAIGAAPLFSSAGRAARGTLAPQIQPAFTPPSWARVESPGEVAAINAGGRSWITPSTGELSGRGIPGDPLTGAAQRQYEAVRNAPVGFHPVTGPSLQYQIEQHIQSPAGGAFNRASAPGVYSTVQQNTDAWATRGGPVTASDLDTLRSQLRNLPPGPEAVAGRRASNIVEGFMSAPPAGYVVRGTPNDLAELRTNIANARGNYRAGETAEAVERGIDRAGTRTATTHSGMNLENATRQQMQQLGGVDVRTGRPYLPYATAEERAAITDASQPGWWDAQKRLYGKLLGGGGGLGQWQAMTAGTGAGYALAHALNLDPVTSAAIGAGVGTGIRSTGRSLIMSGNERAVQQAEDAAALIRRNSPEFQARAAAPDNYAATDPRSMARDAITYALMPKVATEAQNAWDQQFVPYENRTPE